MQERGSIDIVTGGAGFIGSHLCCALLKSGRRVRVIDNLSSGRLSNLEGLEKQHPQAFEFVEGDIRDPAVLRRCLEGAEHVYHQAAMTSVEQSVRQPEACHAVNCTGTLQLLHACRQAGARKVILASSAAVYGNDGEQPRREDLLLRPISPYAASKLAAEHYAQVFCDLYGLPALSLRYFNVFGPRQDPRSEYAAVIPRFISRLLEGRPPVIFGDGKQSRDFVYVEDVVSANLLGARSSAAGIALNIASGHPCDLKQLAAHLSRIFGCDLKPVHEAARCGDIRRSEADIRLARQTIGYIPQVSLEEGLSRTVRAYQQT